MSTVQFCTPCMAADVKDLALMYVAATTPLCAKPLFVQVIADAITWIVKNTNDHAAIRLVGVTSADSLMR